MRGRGRRQSTLPPALLDRASKQVLALRQQLEASLEGARRARVSLIEMDSESLLGQAATRQQENEKIASMQKTLRHILDSVSVALGKPAHSASEMRIALEAPEAPLADALSEIAALASTLREADTLNVQIGKRGLAVVSGYLSAVRPETQTYGRSGLLDSKNGPPRRSTSRHA